MSRAFVRLVVAALTVAVVAAPSSAEAHAFAQRYDLPVPLWLYLTGADICSAGVAGGLFGGVLTVSAIRMRDMVGACAKRAKALHATQATSAELEPAPAR